MDKLNIWSSDKKEVELQVDLFTEDAVDKIIDRAFLFFGVEAPVRMVQKNLLPEDETTEIKIKPVLNPGPAVYNDSKPKRDTDRLKAGKNLDAKISEFVRQGMTKNFSKPNSTKKEFRIARGETIDNESEMAKPYEERIYVPVSLECPSCGHAGTINVRYGQYYAYCNKCSAKLHMRPATDTYGIPDEMGVYYHVYELQHARGDKPLFEEGGDEHDQPSNSGRSADEGSGTPLHT